MDYKNYQVLVAEPKVSQKTGKSYKKIAIQAPEGNRIDVNIFPDFPDYANIAPGSDIRGALEQRGEYWNIVSETQGKGRFGASGGFKTAQIEKVMDIKRQDIAKSQENKENSIKVASTIRMAVDIATSLTPEQWQSTTMQEEIRFWREWLWLEWDKTGSQEMPPF